jgi:hypothetical protein
MNIKLNKPSDLLPGTNQEVVFYHEEDVCGISGYTISASMGYFSCNKQFVANTDSEYEPKWYPISDVLLWHAVLEDVEVEELLGLEQIPPKPPTKKIYKRS